jgi:hypothetical protein
LSEYLWELFLKQNRVCSLSGLPLRFVNAKQDGNASLDRIDSNKGYIVGNVQWVDKNINAMKSDLSEDDFIRFCSFVTKHRLDKLPSPV